MKSISRKILKTVLWFGGIMVLGFMIASLLVALPKVQSWLVMNSQGYLGRLLGTKVEITGVDIAFPHKAILEEVSVYDCHNLPFVKMEALRVNLISFSFWNFFFKRDEPQRFKVSGLDLIAPEVIIYRSSADSSLNLQCIIDKLKPKNPSGDPAEFVLDIASVHLEKGQFYYSDSLKMEEDSLFRRKLNYRNLAVDSISSDFSILYESTGRVEIHMNQITAREKRAGVFVEHLSTYLVAGDEFASEDDSTLSPFVQLSDISLRSGNTWIKGEIRFPGTTFNELINPNIDKNFKASLADTRVEVNFLNSLIPNSLPLRGILFADGEVEGNRNEIHTRNFSARYLDRTRVLADVDMVGLRDIVSAQMNIRVGDSRVSFPEMQQLLPGIDLPELLQEVRELTLTGNLKGTFYDFLINAQTQTEFGNIRGKLNIKLPPVKKIITYEGDLFSENLNLNEFGFSAQQPSSRLNFAGKVKGKGLTLDDIDTYFDARIFNSDLFGYPVDSIRGNLNISKHEIAGNLVGSDGTGYADLKVDLDLLASPAAYKVDGNVKNVNLATYKIYDKPILFTSQMHIDMTGDSLDALIGDLRLTGMNLQRVSDSAEIDVPDLFLQASRSRKDEKILDLKSSLIDTYFKGAFTIKRTIELVKRLGYESSLYFANDDSVINEYYLSKVRDTSNTYVEFELISRTEVNQIFEFLDEPFYLADSTILSGEFRFGFSDEAYLRANSDSMRYNGISSKKLGADLQLIKNSTENRMSVGGGIGMELLSVGPKLVFETVNLEVVGLQDTLVSDLNLRQKEIDNDLDIRLITSFSPDGRIETVIDSANSFLLARGDSLVFNRENRIIYNQREVDIRNLMLEDEESYLRLDGVISENPQSYLTLYLAQLDIDFLNDLYPIPFHPGGKINADLNMKQLLADPEFRGLFRVDEFHLDDYAYGDIYADAFWRQSENDVRLRASMLDETDTTLTLMGNYHLEDSVAPINMVLLTQQGFPLDYIYPFVKTQLYGIKGNVELEEFSIKGNFKELNVNGIGHFEEAGFGIDYFQTDYSFDGNIYFDNDRITFPRITLYDKNRNHADFHGVIRHRGLREFDFDLQMDEVRNFLVMNTRKQHNELFYGTMYMKDGIADITGNLDKLVVQAIASSGPNSHLRIPVTYENDLGKPDFIHFTTENLGDKGKVETGLKGFELNLTAIATEDIQIDLIFDERVGDIMKGRGEGVINLKVTQDGEFTMFGDYTVSKGEYLFTAQNVLNKKFEVNPGGTIKWSGDPFGAALDIEAVYALNADIKDLIQEERSIRVPVQVLMHLQGLLLQPEIQLSINLPNLNEQGVSQIASYLKNIEYDEQELNKQVFSLMVFNRFAPTGGFSVENVASTGAGVTTSVSELLSNQLNYWLSQVMSDKVSVNVNTTNFQDVNLLVSAKLFNDRVTLERDGAIVGPTSNFSLGNISLNIKLLPKPGDEDSGRSTELVLEVFNRESLDLQEQNNTNKAGIGIFFKKDFDTLSELFSKPKPRPKPTSVVNPAE